MELTAELRPPRPYRRPNEAMVRPRIPAFEPWMRKPAGLACRLRASSLVVSMCQTTNRRRGHSIAAMEAKPIGQISMMRRRRRVSWHTVPRTASHRPAQAAYMLKLYGMRSAYDEVMTTAIKRQHEPPWVVGDLLSAETGNESWCFKNR